MRRKGLNETFMMILRHEGMGKTAYHSLRDAAHAVTRIGEEIG
jgi:hypothetical protein